jgi:hypothetical protein
MRGHSVEPAALADDLGTEPVGSYRAIRRNSDYPLLDRLDRNGPSNGFGGSYMPADVRNKV